MAPAFIREKFQRFFLLGFSLVTATALLTGCTHKSSEKDNTIYYPVSANIKGMDPANADDVYSNVVISNIFETLYQYNYLKRPLVLEPLLAASMPEVSKDGMTVTIKIKKGIKYQDSEIFPGGKGRELVANDFIYGWKRLADPANQSAGFWIFDGKIKGLNEWRDLISKNKATYDTPVEGLQAPDAHTLVIKLTKPYYQLNYVLAMDYAAPIPPEAIKKYGKEFLNHPVGTGAYKLDHWTRGSKAVLVKNKNYHGETYPTEGATGDKEAGLLKDAGKALPFADKLVFYEMIESQPQWLNFMKGDLDIVGIPKDNFDTAIKSDELSPDLKKRGIRLDKSPDPDVTYTAFNMEDPLLGKNVNLRRAISLAIDDQTLIKKFFNGRAIIAQSPVPPDIDGYDKDFKNPYKDFNIEKAKEYLKKAGYPNGKGLPTLEYSTINSTTARQMAEYFQQNMAKIGIKIKIISNSWPQFTDRIKDKKAQIWGIAWSADYPDAQNFFQLLYGPNKSPGSNGANYQNKQFDKLYEASLNLPPGPKRTEIYKKMRDIFVQDMPWVPELHRKTYTLIQPWLYNFKRNAVIYGTFKYLRVDPKQRAEMKAKL